MPAKRLSLNEKRRIAIPVSTSADFEYNRRSWPMYANAVREAGGTPVRVELGLSLRALMELARACEGVLLPGSPADVNPHRYGQEAEAACARADEHREIVDQVLLEAAYAEGKPVLGICFGAQSLNVWRGGTLVQDLQGSPVNHSAGASVAVAHSVFVVAGGILDRLIDRSECIMKLGQMRLAVNSSHHQSVERVGDGLRVAAISLEDGVIEAIEAVPCGSFPEFVVGIQWHPERSVDVSGTSRGIFRGFLEAVAAREISANFTREC